MEPTVTEGQTVEPALPPDPLEHVVGVVKRSGTSFLLGMQLLPRERRNAMFAIYAFGREVDDVADEPGAVDDKLRRLDGWRTEVDRLFDGAPTLPTTIALAEPVSRFALPRDEFLLLIDGMEMDARELMRAPEPEVLEGYCRRVAGTIGLLSLPVFGAQGSAAQEFGLALADALQLTNILRDVEEDAERDRLYLPADLLVRHGIDPKASPKSVLAHPARPRVCADLAELARARYTAADSALARCDRRPLLPALLMMGIYETVLEHMICRCFPLVPGGYRLSKPGKLWAALRRGYLRPKWQPSI
ncbi:MAG: presqualene diphosphate synthase HpnD [Azospirillum sp.]|nr:presqualene diphosphate synthase HpnD [Azospirillum sp.]